MKQPDLKLTDEKGSTLVLALMILVLLTLIGIAATNTSTIEIQIAGNEKAYKEAFYKADAGVSFVLATNPPVAGLVPPVVIAREDLDGDGSNDFAVTLLPLTTPPPPPGDPIEIKIQSDSSGGRGNASIIAGVRYPPTGGAFEGSGDEGSY